MRSAARFTSRLISLVTALVRSGAVLMLLLLTACPRRTAIWLVGQEAPGRPVFSVGETYGGRPTWLGVLIVAPCERFDGTGRSALWMLVQDTTPSNVISRVTYGRVPVGYAATAPMSTQRSRTAVAAPLAAGCYIATTDGTGRVRFTISDDGSALESASE